MKKKIGELTLIEVEKICNKHNGNCRFCELYNENSKDSFLCKKHYPNTFEEEIEVDE